MNGRIARQLRKAADYDRDTYQHIKKVYKKLRTKRNHYKTPKGTQTK